MAAVRIFGSPSRTLRALERLHWRQPVTYVGWRGDFADPGIGVALAYPSVLRTYLAGAKMTAKGATTLPYVAQ